jgi:hypothetical protein
MATDLMLINMAHVATAPPGTASCFEFSYGLTSSKFVVAISLDPLLLCDEPKTRAFILLWATLLSARTFTVWTRSLHVLEDKFKDLPDGAPISLTLRLLSMRLLQGVPLGKLSMLPFRPSLGSAPTTKAKTS